MTEDKMVGWHHQLNGHEFRWTPGVGDGHGGLACCGSWGRTEARRLGLDALVETHSEEEIRRAVAVGADIIGVNCRDLSNFTVDVSISERLLKAIPDGIVKVAESGIRTAADIARLKAAGANAFLIGTTLMKSTDPEATLRQLT